MQCGIQLTEGELQGDLVNCFSHTPIASVNIFTPPNSREESLSVKTVRAGYKCGKLLETRYTRAACNLRSASANSCIGYVILIDTLLDRVVT